MRTMMMLQFLSVKLLSHKHICDLSLREDCIVHDARYGCVFCVHIPSNCRYYVPAIRNCMLKKKSLTALRQALNNATSMNCNFAMRNSAMMKSTKMKYSAGLPAALCTNSILFSDQQRSHNLHVLRIADSDFDAFVCSDELVCRTALFPPCTCLVVADILVRHCNLHFVIVLLPMSVLHLVFLSCLNHRMRELQMNLRPSICSSVCYECTTFMCGRAIRFFCHCR